MYTKGNFFSTIGQSGAKPFFKLQSKLLLRSVLLQNSLNEWAHREYQGILINGLSGSRYVVKSTRGRCLIRFSFSDIHRDSSIKCRRLPMPNFCATKKSKKVRRQGKRVKILYEKLTPGQKLLFVATTLPLPSCEGLQHTH